MNLITGEAGVSECLLSFRSAQAEDRDRDRHRLFARMFIEGFTNPYCIEYECAAGECAANLQSVKVPRAKRSRAKPFYEWAVPAYITAVTAEVPLAFFLQNSFNFQKVLHLKDLNRHLECILM